MFDLKNEQFENDSDKDIFKLLNYFCKTVELEDFNFNDFLV